MSKYKELMINNVKPQTLNRPQVTLQPTGGQKAVPLSDIKDMTPESEKKMIKVHESTPSNNPARGEEPAEDISVRSLIKDLNLDPDNLANDWLSDNRGTWRKGEVVRVYEVKDFLNTELDYVKTPEGSKINLPDSLVATIENFDRISMEAPFVMGVIIGGGVHLTFRTDSSLFHKITSPEVLSPDPAPTKAFETSVADSVVVSGKEWDNKIEYYRNKIESYEIVIKELQSLKQT